MGRSDETIILKADCVFKWDGAKRKQTVFKATLGRLVLTNHRLVFLSTGKNDLSVMKFAAGARGTDAVLGVSSTTSLELSALTNEGAIDVPAMQLRRAELHGMFKVLTVTWVDGAGTEHGATLAEKNGGMPDGPTWVVQIQRLAAPMVAVTQAEPNAAVPRPASSAPSASVAPQPSPSIPPSQPNGWRAADQNSRRVARSVEVV